jgi:hypothetical protein
MTKFFNLSILQCIFSDKDLVYYECVKGYCYTTNTHHYL